LEFFLAQHPEIKCARKKEVGFFSRDKVYDLGADWYAKQFPHRDRPGVLLFEATPEYLYNPFVAERIFRFNPEMKLIILLRNPVERAFSAWNMFRQFHADPRIKEATIAEYLEGANPESRNPLLELLGRTEFPDFDSCVKEEINLLQAGKPQALEPSLVRRGLYHEQIQRFYRQFPKENILILESTELKTRRAAALNGVLRFLGLPEADWERTDLQDKHVRQYDAPMSDSVRDMLRKFFEPHNAELYSFLGREFDWDGKENRSWPVKASTMPANQE
jgi:hypothetical protein